MKRIDVMGITRQWRLLVLLAIVACFAFPAYPRTDDCVLLLHQAPFRGGTVTPDIGVAHTFKHNKTITLTAVPNPGYHFVYWLGDVSEPTTNNTTVTLNSPKFIIAVFTRNRFEFMEPVDMITPNGGGGRLLSRPSLGATGLPHQATSRRPEQPAPFVFVLPPSSLTIEETPFVDGNDGTIIIDEEPFVDEGEGTIIIDEEPFVDEGTIIIDEEPFVDEGTLIEPIPEPCTLTLFVGAGLLMLRRRRKTPG